MNAPIGAPCGARLLHHLMIRSRPSRHRQHNVVVTSTQQHSTSTQSTRQTWSVESDDVKLIMVMFGGVVVVVVVVAPCFVQQFFVGHAAAERRLTASPRLQTSVRSLRHRCRSFAPPPPRAACNKNSTPKAKSTGPKLKLVNAPRNLNTSPLSNAAESCAFAACTMMGCQRSSSVGISSLLMADNATHTDIKQHTTNASH